MEGINAQDRFRGYKLALAKYNIPENEKFITYGDYGQRSGVEAMSRFLALEERPTAVFAANDLMAMGAIKAIKDARLEIPRDVAVVGFDDLLLASISDPPMTSVHQPIFDVGKEAVRLLVGQMQNNQKLVQKVVLDTELIIRESTLGKA